MERSLIVDEPAFARGAGQHALLCLIGLQRYLGRSARLWGSGTLAACRIARSGSPVGRDRGGAVESVEELIGVLCQSSVELFVPGLRARRWS